MNKRFPRDAGELNFAPPAPTKFTIALGNTGQIAIQIFGTGNPAIEGKWVELTPQPDGPNLKWTCVAPNIERKLLPASCRQ